MSYLLSAYTIFMVGKCRSQEVKGCWYQGFHHIFPKIHIGSSVYTCPIDLVMVSKESSFKELSNGMLSSTYPRYGQC